MYAGSASASLAAELDLLLHLLAVVPNLACSQSSTQHQPPLFPTGAAASLYAGRVLSLSGQSQVTSHDSIWGIVCKEQLYAQYNRMQKANMAMCLVLLYHAVHRQVPLSYAGYLR